VPVTPPGDGGFAFLDRVADGVPVRFDPCQPVRYVVHGGGTPDAAADVAAALRDVAAATGLVFLDEGPSREAPRPGRSSYQPDRYGERYAPVLIAFATAADYPPVAGLAGVAGPLSEVVVDRGIAPGQPPLRLDVSGLVVIEAEHYRAGQGDPRGRAENRQTLLHELGHLVGLGHVEDPEQVMYGRGDGPVLSGYGAGDRRGLARLGAAAGCPRA